MKREEIIAYEIYVKSFNDTNGDGIGDIPGIIEKLDYLKELGINYIWLTPIYISPQKDNGYDVEDYYKINPDYGTMEDFDKLVDEAKSRGINIMLDMVLNHTSTEHEWFKRALAGEEKYQDYYIFKESEKEPTNWKSKFGGSAWEYVENLNKWYLHLFDVTQADLNWENPELKEELYKIVNFWKEKGVKGFRFDVINLISKPQEFNSNPETDGREFYTDGPRVHEFIRELNLNTFGSEEGFSTVGEMSSTSLDNCIKYSNLENDELSMTFNFHHLKIDYVNNQKWVLKDPDFEELIGLYKNWSEGMQVGNGWMANFISNHDQPRHLSRWGNEDELRYEAATSFATAYILLRGTPFIYYGEEIGMLNAGYESINYFVDIETHNAYKELIESGKTNEEAMVIIHARSRDNGRIPMQWDSTDSSGFTNGKPWLPTSQQYKNINLELDRQNNKSIFEWYKNIISLRKNNDAFIYGEVKVDNTTEGVLKYTREYNGNKYIVICNLLNKEIELTIDEYEIIINNYDEVNNNLLKPYQAIVQIIK